MNNIKISIIITIFNQKEFIAKCLNSVIHQTLKELEIIIINDGSSDGCDEVIAEYQKKHSQIKYYKQVNKGVSSARNLGLKKATGDYITFLDGDDYVNPDAYEKLYYAAKRENSDTIIGDITCISTERVWKLSYMRGIFKPNLPLKRHISQNYELVLSPSVCNKLFKAELLVKNNILFDESLSVGEDLLFTMKSLFLSNYTIVEYCDILNYRVGDTASTLSKKNNLNYFEELLLLEEKINIMNKELSLNKIINEIEHRQLNFFLDSIFLKAGLLKDEEHLSLLKLAQRFFKTISHINIFKEFLRFNVKKKLLFQIIIDQNYEAFISLIQRKGKNIDDKDYVINERKVFHSLYDDFPQYKELLEIKKVEIKHQIEKISLRDTTLTVDGFVFIEGLNTDEIKKELIFTNGSQEKKFVLENIKRTDITYKYSSNKINYDNAGFKTISIDLSELVSEGCWDVLIRVYKDDFVWDVHVEVILAQLRNNMKNKYLNNLEISPIYNEGKKLSFKIKKIYFTEKLVGKYKSFKRNLRYDLSFLKTKDITTFLIICAYKLLGGVLSKTGIWVIGERKDTAQDNSYHFFKYIRENHKKIRAYYVIDKNSNDYQIIKKYKNIIQYGSPLHTFLLLVSEKTINSYLEKANMYTESYKKIVKYYPEWQSNEKIFLQHGVIGVSRVNHVLHKNRIEYSTFIVSSQFEKEHILNEFGYAENEVAVTGLARWDALEDQSSGREILLMPTWRNWIKTKDQLVESKYFKSFLSLLNNKKLHEFLEKENMILTFYPHYQIQKLLTDFSPIHDRINLVQQGEEGVQSLLKRHSILITDYSTVSFDFAYMRKPVIFYQFDYEEFYSNHYNEGPIDHKKDLFGERLESEEDIIFVLNNLKNLKVNNKLENINRYITKFSDKSHCEEIFKIILKREK